jgi:hypothetical protein
MVHNHDLAIFNVGFLPIVSAYAARLGIVEEIDRVLACKIEANPGKIALAMILEFPGETTRCFTRGAFAAFRVVT